MYVMAINISLSRLLRRQRACHTVVLPGLPLEQGSPVELARFDHITMEDAFYRVREDRPDLVVPFFCGAALYKRGVRDGGGFAKNDMLVFKAQVRFDSMKDKWWEGS